MDKKQIAKEILARRNALDDLEGFGDYMRPTDELDFKFPPAAHHKLLIKAFERLVAGDFDRLLIMMPPGGAKSTYVTIQSVLWYLAKFPEHSIICASNTEGLAESFNRRRRESARTPRWESISGAKVNKDMQGVGKWGTTKGGFVQAVGVGSGIVGVRSNLNVLDDPVLNFEQANSETQMNKQWEWYQADYRSRLIPTGKEVIVTTRWSRRDIPGRILEMIKSGEETGWHVIRIPMEADSPDDPLGRNIGDRLWPEWFTQRQVDENKRDTQRWLGMYQQIPMDETGVWVGAENIDIVDSLPAKLTLVCGVDIAMTVGGGDYTVFAICGIDDDRNLFIVDIIRQQTDVDVTCETFFKVMDTYDITYFYIDDDNTSKMLDRLLVEKCRQRGYVVPMIKMPTRGKGVSGGKGEGKEIRAAPLRGLFMQKRVKILKRPEWNSTLIAEAMYFPAVDHDDQIDALSLIGRQFTNIPAPTKDREKNANIDFFLKEQGGVVKTTIGLDTMFNDQGSSDVLNMARRRY